MRISAISVSGKTYDWESLARKLGAGKLIETAAVESGIPLEDALAWLHKRHEAAAADEAHLRILSAKSMAAGMRALKKLAAGGQRLASEASGSGISSSYASDDLAAAKALLDAGIKIRRLIAKADQKVSGDGERDLFDAPPSAWSFKPRS